MVQCSGVVHIWRVRIDLWWRVRAVIAAEGIDAERRGNNLEGFKDFYLKAMARMP